MSGILSIAVSGLDRVAANFAQSASSIVNASSTGGGGAEAITTGLVALQAEKTGYEADAAVARVAKRLDQALLDILA